VKVCPFCAEELPDEATVCSNCHKDPAAAPAWNVSERPDETSLMRLGDVFGLDGVLPTSDRVRTRPIKASSPRASRASRIPSKVWMSLTLALVPEFALGMIVGLPIPASGLPSGTRLILQAAGYIAGLILGIWGRADTLPSERTGQILATIAIALNGFRLAWTVIESIRYF
jgi:hypothetical protein